MFVYVTRQGWYSSRRAFDCVYWGADIIGFASAIYGMGDVYHGVAGIYEQKFMEIKDSVRLMKTAIFYGGCVLAYRSRAGVLADRR